MSFDASTIAMLKTGIWETVYMTMLSSFLAYVIGLPLGVILVVTDEGGFYPIPWLQKILGLVINLLRSVPFLILLFIVLPLSKIVIGTRIGSPAMIIPLTIAAAPYVARVVESSFREIDAGVIEAAKSMGASTWQIIWKVLLPECKPSLLVGAALAVTTILSYSAMAGFTGRRRPWRHCHQLRLLPLSASPHVGCSRTAGGFGSDHSGDRHEIFQGGR